MNKMAPKTKRLLTWFYLRQRIVEQDGGEELVHHGLFPELILALLKTKKYDNCKYDYVDEDF